MAGVKGRSGGARPNSGPKPKPKAPAQLVPEQLEAQEFLTKVMLGHIEPSEAQLKAATTLFGKRAETGVKEEKAEKAKKAAAGRFGAAPPPLRMVK